MKVRLMMRKKPRRRRMMMRSRKTRKSLILKTHLTTKMTLLKRTVLTKTPRSLGSSPKLSDEPLKRRKRWRNGSLKEPVKLQSTTITCFK